MITAGDDTVGANNVTGVVADYPSIAAAHAALGSTGTIQVIRIDAAVDTSTVTLSKSGGAPGAYLLTAHTDAAVNGPTYAAATSRARISVSSGKCIDVTGNGWTVEKIAVLNTATDDALCVEASWFVGRRLAIQGASYGVHSVFAGAWKLQNSAVVCLAGSGVGIWSFASDPATLHHVSVLSSGTGLATVDYAYATVVQTSGTCDGGGTGGTDNVTQDSSARGGNVRTGVANLFKATGSTTWDLNIFGLNGGLLTGVADYSGSADTATDLAGNARPAAAGFPIDPGCAQIASGPSVLAYASSGTVSTFTSTTETVAINVPSGTKTLVVCASGNDAILSATWNGTAMTAAAAEQNASGTRTRIFLLDNPASGMHNAVVTFTSCNRRWVCVYAIARNGNANPEGLQAADGTTGSGGSVSKSTTTTDADEGAIDILANSGSGANPTPDSPQVLRQKCSGPSFFEAATSCRFAPSAASTSDGWTEDTGYNISLSVVYLKAGSAGSGVTVTDGIASCGFTAIVGTATEAAASASGVVAAAALSAIAGTTVEAAASASGVAAALALSAVVGSATEAAASAAGAIAFFTLSAIDGSTTLAAASATGVVAAFALSPVAGTATEAAASASGAIAQFAFDAVPGTTNTGGVYVSGEIAGVAFDAIAGTSSAAAAGAAGLVASTTFDAVAGAVTLPATSAAGAIAQLAFGAVGGETLTVAPDPRPTRSITVGNVWSVTAGGARSETAGEVRTHSVGVRSETR